MISGALSGPSGCLWYDEGTTKLLGQYLISMESCDVQDSNNTSYICVTSVCQSKWPLKWSPVHWMNHLAVCDMQDSDRTSYKCVTSVHQSKQPLWWSSVRWMDHPAVCDMMRGLPSFLLSILYHWNAVICRMQTVYLIYVQPQYISQCSLSNHLYIIKYICLEMSRWAPFTDISKLQIYMIYYWKITWHSFPVI